MSHYVAARGERWLLAFNPKAEPAFKVLKVRQGIRRGNHRSGRYRRFLTATRYRPDPVQPPRFSATTPTSRVSSTSRTRAKQLLKDASIYDDFWYMSVTRGYFPTQVDRRSYGERPVGRWNQGQSQDERLGRLPRRPDQKATLALHCSVGEATTGDPANFAGYFFKANKVEFSYDNADLRTTLTKAAS